MAQATLNAIAHHAESETPQDETPLETAESGESSAPEATATSGLDQFPSEEEVFQQPAVHNHKNDNNF